MINLDYTKEVKQFKVLLVKSLVKPTKDDNYYKSMITHYDMAVKIKTLSK